MFSPARRARSASQNPLAGFEGQLHSGGKTEEREGREGKEKEEKGLKGWAKHIPRNKFLVTALGVRE